MNGPIASAGSMFAFFSRIGTAEPTTAAKQRTISRETGVVRAIPAFQVNKKVINPSTIEHTIPSKTPTRSSLYTLTTKFPVSIAPVAKPRTTIDDD